MFDRNAEWQRLRQHYASLSDAELLSLGTVPDSLTDDAQTLLSREIERRNLVFESVKAFQADSPLSSAATLKIAEGEVVLTSFHDMFAAGHALDLLDEASIPFRLRTEEAGWQSGVSLMHIYIHEEARAAAEDLLRRNMGLFPLQEWPDQPEEADDAMLLLADLETQAEADDVLRLLRQAGIECRIAPQDEDAEPGWISVEVRAAVYQRALDFLTEDLKLDETPEA